MPVIIEHSGPCTRIVINRPERSNAINAEVIGGIADGIRAATTRLETRVIVLTGAGDRAFCAGGDLAPAADGAPFVIDPAHPRHYVVDLFKLVEDCNLPIIGRVNGHALAGGLGLVCACDMVIASEDATFGTPESKIGLFPMMIMPYMLRVLPLRRFMELCFTGDAISAREAMEWGLVNKVVPHHDLDAAVDALVEKLASRSPTAIRLGKQGFHAMRDMAMRQALEYSQLMLPTMASTEDAREGLRSFQEKRKPEWSGR